MKAQHRFAGIALGLVLALVLVTSVSARPLQEQWSPGSGTTGITLMNVDPSREDATFVVSLYGQGPSPDASISGEPAIPYNGERRLNLTNYAAVLGTGWRGSVVVSSDRQLVAVGHQRYENPAYSSGDGWNGGAYMAAEPATKVYMPYLTEMGANAYNAGRWSRLTVQNTGGTTADVYVSTYTFDGVLESTVVESIESNHSFTWEPDYTPDGNRSAVITSTNPVVASFDGFWSMGLDAGATAWSTSYEGIPAADASSVLVYPDVFRGRYGGVETGDWVQWSNILIQNASLDSTANITATFTNVQQQVKKVITDTILPNSSKAYNTRYASGMEDLGAGFLGSVRVESDQPLVGVCHSFWDYAPYRAGATYLAKPPVGAYTLHVPFMNRKGGDPITAWSKLSVYNVGTVTGTLKLYFYDSSGNPVSFPEAAAGCDVGPLASKNYNTSFGSSACGISAETFATRLGNSFVGTVVVSSTTQVLGGQNQIFTTRIDAVNVYGQ